MDEETKKLLDEMSKSVKSYNEVLKEVQDLVKAKADQTKIEEIVKANKETADNIIKLSDQLDAIQLKMKDSVINGKTGPWIVTLAKELKGDKFKKGCEKGGRFEVTFTTNPYSILKLAGSMVTDDNLGGLDLNTSVVVPMREAGVFKAPDRPLTILDIVTKGTTTSDQVVWVEEISRIDGAAAVAEAGLFVQSDIHWALKKVPIEKIGTFYKVSNETLDDWDYTLSEINTRGISQLERELEEEVTSGNATSPHLAGVVTRARAFTYAGLNGKQVKTNLKDIVNAMKTQVRKKMFRANYVALNIDDIAEYEGLKDANGQYLFQTMLDGSKRIAGLPVVECDDIIIPPGFALVGDFTKDKLFMRREITIEMFDQDGTDAEYDMKMIRLKLRGANRIMVCDYNAFVYDAIADVSALISAI